MSIGSSSDDCSCPRAISALGPTSGQPLTRRGRPRDRRPLFLPGELCCDLEGFPPQAKVSIEVHDRAGIERLCRYIARPAIASERLSLDPDEFVVYRRDRTRAILFEPLAFLERLAALVPGLARISSPTTACSRPRSLPRRNLQRREA